MRKYYYLLLFLCYACSPNSLSLDSNLTINKSEAIGDFVTMDMLRSLWENEEFLTKTTSSKPVSITPYIASSTSDTVMYIVNYGSENGWKIVSADSRTPAILAECGFGEFSFETENKGLLSWVDCMGEDMAAIRRLPSENLTFSQEDILRNKSFWKGEPLYSRGEASHGENGHFEIYISTISEFYDSLAHMVPQWTQSEPYNSMSPFTFNSSTTRAPAGCVAVAGAQVLYFLHNKYGAPQSMYSSGYCSGNISSFTRVFDNPTTTSWADMDTTYNVNSTGPEPILIGKIGQLVSMHYDYNVFDDDYFSWAVPANLRTCVFEPYGYECSHGNYDDSIAKQSLANGLPVILIVTMFVIQMKNALRGLSAPAAWQTPEKFFI